MHYERKLSMPLRRLRLCGCLGLSLLLLLGGTSCDDWISDPGRDALDVPLSEILELSRTGGNQPLLADGQSADTIIARIPDNPTTRKVTFRTTLGLFRASGTKEVTVTAERIEGSDERLVGKVVLVADTLPGTAAVSATVGDFTQYLAVPFIRP